MFGKSKLAVMSLVTISLLLITSGALAFESKRASQNMLQTRSATAVDPGQFELRLGLDYTRPFGRPHFDDNWGLTRGRPKMRLWDWNATVSYGVVEGVDVFMSTGWFDVKDRLVPWMGGDKYGRGLKDLALGATLELPRVAENIGLAYIPEVFVPVGRRSKQTGRLGLGRDYWEVNNTLAMTVETEPVLVNANLSHSIPLGQTRVQYTTPFMLPRGGEENVRGITELGVEAVVPVAGMVQPMANLNYSHQWISHGPDSDLVTAGIGAKVQLPANTQAMVGYNYPVAGRNSLRAQTFQVALIGEF